MKKTLRQLSVLLLILALAGAAAMLVFDAHNLLTGTSDHQRVGAFSVMLVGCSFISLHLSGARPGKDDLRRIVLGVAFFLWGCEQLVSPGKLVTVMDAMVVVVFVSDSGLSIWESLKHKSKEMS